MDYKQSRLRLVLLLAAALAASTASAQGWIAGGTAGAAEQEDYLPFGAATVSKRDDTDAAGRVFGGYLISPIQGVVVSYIDMGETKFAGPDGGGYEETLEADGIDVSYFIRWAPGSQQRFSLFGTVGLMSWDQKVAFSDSTDTFRFSDDGTSFTLGGGIETNLRGDGTSPWTFQLALQTIKDVGNFNNSGHEYDRNMASLGVRYGFGRPRD